MTHGAPRNHIWTFAAGASEGGFTQHIRFNCPCSNCSHPHNTIPPSFVGSNYYCESGYPASTVDGYHLYSSVTLSGMASSVSISVAAMENLLHGSP